MLSHWQGLELGADLPSSPKKGPPTYKLLWGVYVWRLEKLGPTVGAT